MKSLATKLTDYIFFKGIISKEDYMMYRYGLQIGMEMILCMAISSLIAIYLKSFLEFIVFIIVFFPLRSYFGGIHMKHFFLCLICSCTVISSVLFLVKKFVFINQIAFILILFLLLGIYKLSSFMMKRQKIDCDEKNFLKRQQKRILVIVGVLALIFYVFNLSTLETLLMYTIFVVFTSLILEELKRHNEYK